MLGGCKKAWALTYHSKALIVQVASTLTGLRTVIACFPLGEGTDEVGAASDEEGSLLRQLAAKQLKAEQSARRAVAASRRTMAESSQPERYCLLCNGLGSKGPVFLPKS